MPTSEEDKLNRIEELKTKLFSNNYQTKIGGHESFSLRKNKNVHDSWENDGANVNTKGTFFKKKSASKKFFIFSIVFFILAVGYGAYMFFAGGNTVSNDNIDISVVGNTFTTGGEEFPLVIGITNRNSSPLELVDLVVEYPKGSSTDSSQDTERFRQSLGAIPAGSVKNESMKIVLFGEQGTVREIKISIEYRVAGSNAIFVKEKLYDVSIKSSPINLSIDAPTEISTNQELTLSVKETLNAAKPATGMLLKLDYPFGFQFISATPAPSFDNNVWDLGDLSPGVEHSIAITGKMVDVSDGEEKVFHVSSGSKSLVDKSVIGVVFNSLEHTVAISKPFIEAKLFVNGVYQNEYASDTRTPIQGQIRWVNNLNTRLNDVQIRAKITGNALNRKTINAHGGFYNSIEDTIVWDKNFKTDFAEVNPGDSGAVDFIFSPLTSIDLLSDPSINIEVSITGKQPLEGNTTKTLNNSESKIIRIISDTGLATKMLYYSGPFVNTGSIPPVAEKETTYTVVWTLSNTSNNISDAHVHSSLPPWVRFVGPISPTGEDLKYDDATKEIMWNIGMIPKGTGISGQGRQVAFQVAFIPSLSQVNTAPVIINDATLTGYDDFAKVNVRVNRASLTTVLSNDPAFPATGGRVVDH